MTSLTVKQSKPRKVFGRRKFNLNGSVYKFELRADGLWVRQHRHHREFIVPFEHILRLSQVQTELFPTDPVKLETAVREEVNKKLRQLCDELLNKSK